MQGKETRDQNTRSLLFTAVEVGVFTAIFAVAGAWPAPDVNEGYYHSWQMSNGILNIIVVIGCKILGDIFRSQTKLNLPI